MERKRGVSLITVIITMIIILILASTVIFFISKKNLIEEERKNKLKVDLQGFDEELEKTYKRLEEDDSSFDRDSVTALTEELVRKYIPSLTNNYADSVTIVKGKLHYESANKNETTYVTELGYTKEKNELPKKVKLHEVYVHPESDSSQSYLLADGTLLIISKSVIDEKETIIFVTKLDEYFDVEWEKKYSNENFKEKSPIGIVNTIIKKDSNILLEFISRNIEENECSKTCIEIDLKGNVLNEKFFLYANAYNINSVPKIQLEDGENTYIASSTEIYKNDDGVQKTKINILKLDKEFKVIGRGEITEEDGDIYCTNLTKDKAGNYIVNSISYTDNIIYKLDKSLNFIKRGFIKAPSTFGKIESGSIGNTFFLTDSLYNFNSYKTVMTDKQYTVIRTINEDLRPVVEVTKNFDKRFKTIVSNFSNASDGNVYLYGITNKKNNNEVAEKAMPYIEKLDKKLNEIWRLSADVPNGCIMSVKDIGDTIYLYGERVNYLDDNGTINEENIKFVIECEF